MKHLTLLLAAFTLSACTTIHFDNGEVDPATQPKVEKWHHIVALDLVEVSDPVDPEAVCEGGEWAGVKTEKTFLNGLAGSAVNFFVPLWYPKTASVTCR